MLINLLTETSPCKTDRRAITSVLAFAVFAVTLVSDQLSKYFVSTNMRLGESIPHDGPIVLTYVTNSGSAFGLFPNQTLFLIIASFIGICVLMIFYKSHHFSNPYVRLSLGLQLGGAFGNLIDRVRLGHVVDFIDLGWWPVFNLADSAIVIGLCCLMICIMLKPRTDVIQLIREANTPDQTTTDVHTASQVPAECNMRDERE